MSTLIFDIETVVDPTMPPYRPEDTDAFPPPPYWRVETIGALWLDDAGIARRLAVLPGATEEARVDAFLAIAQQRRPCPTLVTYGGRKFDMPVMTGAAMRAGRQFSRRFDLMSKRYDSKHVDLFDRLGDFGACQAGGLDAWARSLGWPGKLDDSGKRVSELLAEGRREHVEVYCLADVVLTAGVFLRLEHCHGDLTSDGYVAAVAALLALARADVRLGVWLSAVNEERVLRVHREPEPVLALAQLETPAEPAPQEADAKDTAA